MLTIVELATLAAPATGSIFPCTRPCYLPGIPDRDYQYGSHSPIQEAVSAQGVTVELEVAPGLGKPGRCQLEPEGFWVQRGVPLDYRIQGYSPDAQRYFSRIDRILVVFSYQ